MSGGNLILPRVRVMWGDVNLSSYNGSTGGFPENEPLIYDVRANLSAENEGPTAEMKWNPTGPAMKVYEELVSSYMDKQIRVEFFYSGGKTLPLIFMWSGQSISYGNDMGITVKMVSELAGMVNGNIRSTAQARSENKGAKPTTFLQTTAQQFSVDYGLFKFNEATKKHWDKKVTLQNMYGNDWTLGNAASQISKQTGDIAIATNIGEAGIVFFPPFSYPGTKPNEVEIATAKPQEVDVKKRYGFILGPSIITSVTRTSDWKPPQQDNNNLPGTQPRARKPSTEPHVQQKPPTNQQTNVEKTGKATSAPVGTANNRANLSILNKDNPEGPSRANALNDEKGSKLDMETLMCPLLCGIKPTDVMYLPSLTGEFIEDWIVQQVGYSQNNGQVNINIQATRAYGLGTPMNQKEAEKFKQYAESIGLIGKNASLENWDKYAWGIESTSATASMPEFGVDSAGTLATAAGNLTQAPFGSKFTSGLF
jgi:hypothetical protein